MTHPRYPSDEVVRRGRALYEERIRAAVEPSHLGKFLALDIETGEYEIDTDELAAAARAQARNPNAVLYILRIGYRAAFRIGASFASPRT